MNPETQPLIIVNWEDITSYEEWNEDAEEDVVTTTIKTVGWIIEETPTKIVVASTYSYSDDEFYSKTAFPKLPPEVQYITKKP